MKFLVTIALLLFYVSALAEPEAADTGGPLIFDDDATFEMEMRFEFGDICKNPEEDDCDDVPGTIVYLDSAREKVSVDIRIRTRGRWSTRTARCAFPSLFIFFDEQQTDGTVFEGQKMLPLTTHCQHYRRNYADHVQVEQYAHRLFRMLTDVSLRSRLLSVTYRDADSRLKRKRFAFFVEHFDTLARRTNKTYVEVDDLRLGMVRAEEMAVVSVFQFMIGNLDWSAVKSHNVALFKDESGMHTPVPFDFDYSGIVYTPYGTAPRGVPVYSVLTRHYRGLCWSGLDWNDVFERFQAIREDVFDELAAMSRITGKERRRVRSFLKGFYEVLDSDEARQEKIVGACRTIPESMLVTGDRTSTGWGGWYTR